MLNRLHAIAVGSVMLTLRDDLKASSSDSFDPPSAGERFRPCFGRNVIFLRACWDKIRAQRPPGRPEKPTAHNIPQIRHINNIAWLFLASRQALFLCNSSVDAPRLRVRGDRLQVPGRGMPKHRRFHSSRNRRCAGRLNVAPAWR